MRRLFWLGIGIAVGVLVVRKITKTMNAYSPRGLAGSAQSSLDKAKSSVQAFVDDVREGAAEHEEQLIATVIAEQEAVRTRNH